MKARLFIFLAILSLALGAPAQTKPHWKITAFGLIKIGNKSVDPRASDRVTYMYSEQSSTNLVPAVWHVEYFDPSVPFKKTELKIMNGKVVSVAHPRRVMDSLSGTKQFERHKLKIDSDRALAIALKDPTLGKLDLQATQFWLERTGEGPVWRIRFWMTQLNKPGQLNQIGEVQISTQTGEIYKKELHY